MRRIVAFFILILLAFQQNGKAQEVPNLWPDADWKAEKKSDTLLYLDENEQIRLACYRNSSTGDSIFKVWSWSGFLSLVFEGKKREPLQGCARFFSKSGNLTERNCWQNDNLNDWFSAYFPTGKPKETGRFEDGKKEGIWKTFYETGRIKTLGAFIAEVKDGRWEYFHPDSVLAYSELWAEGELKSVSNFLTQSGKELPGGEARNGNGIVLRYHLSGNRKQKFTLSNGVPDGDFWDYDSLGRPFRLRQFRQGDLEGNLIEFYPDSSKASQTAYQGGKEDGQTLSFHKNGNLALKGWFSKGKEDSTWVEFYESGKPSAQYSFKNGVLNGQFLEYFESQTIQKSGWFTNGLADSITTTWNEKGQKKSEFSSKSGLKEGFSLEWFDNGRTKSEGSFKAGREEGFWKTWFDNGRLQSQGNFSNGQPDGIWKTWFGNGKMATSGTYSNGNENGNWMFYYPNAKLKSEEIWKNGRLVEVTQCLHPKGKTLNCGNLKNGTGNLKTYDLEGNPEGEGMMVQGLQQGEWTYFWPSGKVQAKGKLEKGKRHGLWKFYYLNGGLAEESEYRFDQPFGQSRRFDTGGNLIEATVNESVESD